MEKRRVLPDNLEALSDDFLSMQKPLVSAQGYTSLCGLTARMLVWFDDEDLDPVEAGVQDAVRYLAAMGQRKREDGEAVSTGTVLNYLKVARRFFAFLVHSEKRASNPFLDLKAPRVGKHLSRNVLSELQMGKLLGALERFDEADTSAARLRRYRVHVIAEFLYATGLRIAEAAAVKEADLDLESLLVHVRVGKGGRPRTAFLTRYAAQVLRRYLDEGRDRVLAGYPRSHVDTLFGTDKARLAAVVNEELAGLCAALEIPPITTHGFRHSLGTHLLRSGVDMRHIQAILGHEALQTTQIYTQVDKDDLKRSLDEHHPRHWRREAV